MRRRQSVKVVFGTWHKEKTYTNRRTISSWCIGCTHIRGAWRCCNKNYLEVKGDIDRYNIYKGKILLRRKVTPQRVTLPDGRSFLARYERVSQKNLLSNATIRKNRTIGLRRQRKHKKILKSSGALAKGLNIGSSAVNSEIGKKVIDERIKHAPELYKLGTKKIKNKSLKKVLESDIANYAVQQLQENLFNWQNV